MQNDPETRTKPMDQACRFVEEGPLGYFIEFQPGNGTRYLVGLSRLNAYPETRKAVGGVEEGGWLVTWINAKKCCVLQPEGYLAPHFLQEKLGTSRADAIVLGRLIAHFTDREVDTWEPAETE